jgi:hypothetical protein
MLIKNTQTMERKQMINDLIEYELQFLISNPENISDVIEWIANGSILKLDDEKLKDLWVLKFED